MISLRLIRRRGFYFSVGRAMLSCHINGYGDGSQFAVNFGGQRTGSTWYGWWSDGGWAAKRQKPFKINGVEIPEDGSPVEIPIQFKETEDAV